MNLATSTEFLLLSQKVNLLESYLGWVIGGVTLTITVIIAFFVTVQFIYSRNLQKKDVESLKRTLTTYIEQVADKKALDLQAFVEQNFKDVEVKLEKTTQKNEIEFARLLALTAKASKVFNAAFYWWLKTAYLVTTSSHKVVDLDDVSGYLQSAKSVLALSESSSSFLKERSKEIQMIFKVLKKTHSIEVSALEITFKSKITQ